MGVNLSLLVNTSQSDVHSNKMIAMGRLAYSQKCNHEGGLYEQSQNTKLSKGKLVGLIPATFFSFCITALNLPFSFLLKIVWGKHLPKQSIWL